MMNLGNFKKIALALAISLTTTQALGKKIEETQSEVQSSVENCIEQGKATNQKQFSNGNGGEFSEGTTTDKTKVLDFGDIHNVENACEGIMDEIRKLGKSDRGTIATGGNIYKDDWKGREKLKEVALLRIHNVLGKYDIPKEAISPVVFYLFIDAYINGHINNGFKPIPMSVFRNKDK